MKHLIITLIFILYALAPVRGQQQNSPVTLESRLIKLEQDNKLLKDSLTSLSLKHTKLSSKISPYEPYFENFKSILLAFGAATLFVILSAIFTYYFKIDKKIQEAVNEKITTIFTDRRADFIALLKEYDHEQRVKKAHNIVMLSHASGNDNYHFDLFKKHGFAVSALTNLEQLSEATFTQNDCIIINNEGAHWLPEEVEAFIEAHPNLCFYIGKGQIRTTSNASTRFAAANIRTQVVGNFINLLKYHSQTNQN